ncbi:MAG: MaoC family dehydratase [Chloroflexi bacterium]|nr:MaoC family dehydratase [Chloroflexota bacterium]
MPRYFEDVTIGDELGPLERSIDTEAVIEFCRLWQRELPKRFVSLEGAREEGFPGPIVPAHMIMAHLFRLVSLWAPGSQLRTLDVVLRQPVLHNQALSFRGVVTDTQVQDGHGVVDLDLSVEDPHSERLAGGRGVLQLPLNGRR